MSPEDDVRTDTRVPSIDDVPSNHSWQPMPQTDSSNPPTFKQNKLNGTTTAAAAATASSPPASSITTLSPPPAITTATTTSTQPPSLSIINGKNGINNKELTTNGCHTRSPLLQHNNDDEEHDNNYHQTSDIAFIANNNDWSKSSKHMPIIVAAKATDRINGHWKESQNDEQNGSHRGQSNNNGPLINGKNEMENGNGHPEKLSAEQDPLTGQTRRLDDDENSSCGIGSCKPKWARNFATTHVFMVVFLLAWILQGMYYTYFVSVITTIEKLFQIKSKTTGLLMSATEVGQISTALLLTYYAGRGHRPRWIAFGMILFSISSFGCTIPHFIYGDQLLHASNVFNGGGSGGSNSLSTIGHNIDGSVAMAAIGANGGVTSNILSDSSNQNLCIAPGINETLFNTDKDCKDDILQEQVTHSQITSVVLAIFVVSLLGVGIGQTAVSTLGIPYIDDNVASRESPLYIAITIGVRILGPAAGFILGSFCTRLFVNISVDPGFGPSDPRWVGAWWLGLVLISSTMVVTSLAMLSFPKQLRGNRIPPPAKMLAIEAQKKLVKHEEEFKTPQWKDFPKTIKRQLNNDILMFRTASSVLHLLPVAGLYTFLPKYMESQFRLPAHDANLISGIGGILVMGVGIVISGVVILKFNPTARSVAGWIAFTAIVYSFGMGILMFVGCSMDDFKGLKPNSEPLFEPVCNITCNCDLDKFSPICGSDGMTYFSSCHAGCSISTTENGKTIFTNCQCIPPNSIPDLPDATSGYCEGNCKNFVLFISLFSFFVFMHSTSEVGGMLLIMRCTDPKDKAMAMGIIQFAIGLFGNVPCPIIYGAVVDSACLIWEMFCDKQGACSLYDGDVFRHFFLGTTAGIMLLAFVMDLVVWHKAHRIDIDPGANSETDLDTPAVPESTV